MEMLKEDGVDICYDNDKQLYDVYFDGNIKTIPVEVKIRDTNDMTDINAITWTAYLVKVKYLKSTKNCKELYYCNYKKL